uniref:DNA-directed DNA polymerase n=1 Tax=Tanacetum cinerariifolium TaxID=118510 RepID=A0A6L2KNA2_TANCI|nr:DNA-directed DNA polymerase [Tanacetum cinerariifolium]
MQTRSFSRLVNNPSSNPTPSTNPNPKGRNRRRSKHRIEEFNLDELSPPIFMMADQRTMAQLLQAPTKGYEDFFRHDKEDPHAHIRYFNKITSTLKFPDISNTSIKLMLFPFSLEGATRIWLEKEPPRSIFSWDDLVSKFINQFFPLYKTTNLRNEITNFQQRFDESFSEAWDRFKDLLRACPHHASCSTSGILPDVVELKDMVKELLLDKKSQNQAPATVKAVKKSCVTCGGAHSYRNCPAIDRNIYRDNIQEFISQAFADNYNQGNTRYHPPMMSNQIRPPGFPPVPNNQNVQLNQRKNQNRFNQNQNRGNNFNHGPIYQPSVFEPSAYQAPAYQAPATQTQHVSKEDFPAYVKANDAVMRNMQTQGQNMLNQLTNLTDLLTKFVNSNNASTSSSSTLPSNTIANPRSDLKAITTRIALVDLGASINLMPLSVWNNLSLPDLTPTCMTLELAGRSISHPVGVAEDVYVKLGSFHFLADFVVVDFDADPQEPLILGRSILKSGRALIDVFEDELTLRVGKEAITFNLDQTSRYSANYNDMTAKRIDVINMACEEYSQDVLEVDAFIAIEDDPTSPEVDQSYLDPEGDILLLEAFLNDDPSLPPLNQGNYLLNVRKELKICEAKSNKSSIDEPPEVDLKDLPLHLEYAFLEGDDKLPVTIAKELSMEEKTALITVLKSHNPWVSLVHCVPKKGGFTVVENEDNELILTRLVTGWRVCVNHRKLNEATRKEHFPLPFMDQMLERLAGNQYYCFLDSFSGYLQIPIDPKDQEKTTFTCPYGTFAYRHMPFGLCNTAGTNSFQNCLSHFERMLKRCEDTNLCLNWEKSHFMVKEGIVLGHKILKQGIELEKAKVDVITKLPHPTTVKARPMTRLLEKDTPFHFSKECVEAFQTLKRKLTEAPILIAPDWDMPFELMCDSSDFAIGAVLGKCQDKHFRPIHYATYKTPIGCTPYNLVYGKACHLPIELKHKAYWALKHANLDLKIAGDHRKVQLNELNELRDQAYENSLIYKEKTKRLHDSKIKDHVFNIDDRVLLFNSRLKIFSGKLKSRWSGPFTISHVYPYGTVELDQPDGPNFNVNGHRLKHYFGEDVPKVVVLGLQTFPKDY